MVLLACDGLTLTGNWLTQGSSAIPPATILERVVLNEAGVFVRVAVPEGENGGEFFRGGDHEFPHLGIRDAAQ